MGLLAINTYVVTALSIGLVLVVVRVSRLMWAGARYRFLPMRNRLAVDEPSHYSLYEAFHRVLVKPTRDHSIGTRRLWTFGFMAYHVAIFMLVAGYALSTLLLVIRILRGESVPDIQTGFPGSASFGPINLLGVIFGNAEPVQAQFLFGPYADIFVLVTWVDVVFAVLGNGLLWCSILWPRMRRVATVDFAPAMWPDPHKYLVRGLITLIIASEVLGRADLVPGMVYLHSMLGVTLLPLLTFTYLSHILHAPLLLLCALVRCRARSFA